MRTPGFLRLLLASTLVATGPILAQPAGGPTNGAVTAHPTTGALNTPSTFFTGNAAALASAVSGTSTFQPLDSDLTAIAALSTASAGRSLLTLSSVPSGALVGISDTQTLTNKTLALGSNTVSGTLAQFDTAASDFDFARRDAAQTFTGTQTFGTIGGASSGPTISFGTGSSGDIAVTLGTGKVAINGVTAVGPLAVRTSTGFNLHVRDASAISGTGVALDALNDANGASVPLLLRGSSLVMAAPIAFSGTSTITSASGQALTLATGTSGTALSIASATNAVTLSSTTASTSTTTGSLINSGGFGNAGAIYSGEGFYGRRTAGDLTLNLLTTTSGTASISVSGYGSQTSTIAAANTSSLVNLTNLDSTANTFTSINGLDASGSVTNRIAFVNVNDATNEGRMAFLTRPSGGNLTEWMSLSGAGVLTVSSGTATPAGGSTSARLLFGTTTGFGVYWGSGAPTVSAAQGSIYLRSDGSSTSTRFYVNTDGGTTWTNFTSAL